MQRYNRSNKPQYSSEYFPELNRKLLFREPLVLEQLNYAIVTGGTDTSNTKITTSHNKHKSDISESLEIIMSNSNLKTRLLNIIYAQSKNPGIACLMIRKILLSDRTTIEELHKYYLKQYKIYNADVKNNSENKNNNTTTDNNTTTNSVCFQSDKNLIRDLENLLPYEFTPKSILCLECSATIKNLLQAKFTDAKILTAIDTADKYDLIIASCYLHHQPSKDRPAAAKKIKSMLKPNSYLFVREIDAEIETDILLADKMHDFGGILYYSNVQSTAEPTVGHYVPRTELPSLFDGLTVYAESQTMYNLAVNPTKMYSMLFNSSKN